MNAPAILAVLAAAAIGAAQAADAPASVTSAGVTLKSVAVDLPFGDRAFPGGAGADLMASNCSGCHSAGMVLTQPALSRAEWEGEIAKMRAVYKAPIAAEDVPALASYLAGLKPGP